MKPGIYMFYHELHVCSLAFVFGLLFFGFCAWAAKQDIVLFSASHRVECFKRVERETNDASSFLFVSFVIHI